MHLISKKLIFSLKYIKLESILMPWQLLFYTFPPPMIFFGISQWRGAWGWSSRRSPGGPGWCQKGSKPCPIVSMQKKWHTYHVLQQLRTNNKRELICFSREFSKNWQKKEGTLNPERTSLASRLSKIVWCNIRWNVYTMYDVQPFFCECVFYLHDVHIEKYAWQNYFTGITKNSSYKYNNKQLLSN